MDVKRAIISALAILLVQVALILPVIIANPYASGSLWVGTELFLGIASCLVLLASTYLIAKKYYFGDSNVDNPLRDGLVIGIILSVVFVVALLYAGHSAYSALPQIQSLNLMVGLIPAVTVLAAVDVKDSRKKRFWFF